MNKLKQIGLISLIGRIGRWLTATRRRKILSLILITLITLTSIRFAFFTSRSSDTCKNMQPLDKSALSYFDDSKPLSSLAVKDSQGKEYAIRVEGPETENTIINLIENSESTLEYEITVPEELKLVSEGGYVGIKIQDPKSEIQNEIVAMFRVLQGIDKKGQRVDFKYELTPNNPYNPYTIKLTPARSWQLGCASFPLDLYTGITNVIWYEALVKVGQNSDNPGASKDGDLVAIKPAGWNWGNEERKKYARVKIPILSQKEIEEYLTKTIAQPSQEEVELGFSEKIPDDNPLLSDTSGLARYAIDYTKLSSSEELKAIRDPETESPILDGKTAEIIQKKLNPKVSFIPEDIRLATQPFSTKKPSILNTISDVLVPDVLAAGTIVKTIGTASRDYSTITLWEDGEDGDLVSAQEIHRGEAYADSDFDEQVTIDDSTTNSSYYMWLTAAEGEKHTGVAGTGARLDPTSTTGDAGDGDRHKIISVNDNYTIIEWLELTQSASAVNADDGIGIRTSGNGDGSTFRNNIIHDLDWRQQNAGIQCATCNITVNNNIVYNISSFGGLDWTAGIYMIIDAGDTVSLYNNTIYNIEDNGMGAEFVGAGTFNIENNISVGNGGGYNFWGTGTHNVNYNISSDDTADDEGGSGNIINVTTANQFVSTTSGSEDLHLKSGSDAIEAGTDLSSTFVNDIDGDKRPFQSSWDIGADEFSTGDPPVSEWHFNEGYGSTASDTSTNGNDLTITNATWYVDPGSRAIQSTYLQFDGTGDYASRASDNDFNFKAEGFTITGWFRHPSAVSGTDTLIARYGSAGWKVYMDSSGYICFGIDDDNSWGADDSACTTTSFADSGWHHFSAVKSGISSISIYIDGILRNQDTSISAVGSLNTSSTLYVGIDSDGSSNGWDGFVDEVFIYNYARSANQVKVDYNSGSAQFGSKNPDPLSDGLVGYWKMDDADIDAEGETITDSSGNGNSGTLYGDNGVGDNGSGMDCTATGKFGTGCDFDSTDDYVSIGTSILPDYTDYTLAAWVNLDVVDTKDESIVAKGDGTQSFAIKYDVGDDNFQTIIRESDNTWRIAQFSQDSPAIDTWYHVVGVKDGNDIKIYVDGELGNTTNTITGALKAFTDENWSIGRLGGADTWYIDGTIDEVRIYNRALSPSEVQDLYEWAPGPVAYFPLDEGTGTSTVYDRSGNDQSGTIYNMTQEDWVPGKYGTALEFDDINDFVEIPNLIGWDTMTLEAWFKPTKSYGGGDNNHTIIGARVDQGCCNYHTGIGYSRNASAFGLYITSESGGNAWNNWVNGTTTFSLNTWYHVAGVLDGSSMKIYVNGVLENTNTLLGPRLDTDYNWYFNSGYAGRKQLGIDEVKIYNYARTPAQIIQDMNAGHPAPGSPVGSPVGHWKFDEGYGDTANDIGTIDNDGDLGGSGQTCPATGTVPCPSWDNDGKIDKALSFDGTDDYVDLGTSLDTSAMSGLTASAWFYSSNGTGYIISKSKSGDKGPSNTAFEVAMSGPNVVFRVTTGGGGWATYTILAPTTLGQWNHVTATWDGTDMYLYINGVLGATRNHPGTMANPSTNMLIGAQGSTPYDSFFLGRIDEVKIYNFALTADQVKAEYNFGSAQVFGATSTDSSDNPTWSSLNEYCPPGQGSACTAPVGEWLFNEKTGSNAQDTSENSNTGSFLNTPQWRHAGACHSGSCLEFSNADNDAMDLGDSTDFEFGGENDKFTVEAWVKQDFTAGEDTAIVSKYHSTSQREYWLGIDYGTSKPKLWLSEDGGTGTIKFEVSNNSLTLGEWAYITYTFDFITDDYKIYINGSEVETTDTGSAISTLHAGTAKLHIGAVESSSGSPDRTFPGSIDEVRIYDYVRTPAQIAWEYNRGAPVAWWKLDDNALNEGDTVYDASGNGNNGTLYGDNGSGDNGSGMDCNVTGKRNTACDFDGTDDYIATAADPSYVDITGDISISAWMKAETFDAGYNALVAKDNTDIAYWLGEDGPNQPSFILSSDGSSYSAAQGGTTLQTGQWYHIVGVYNGTDMRVYLNGELDPGTYNPLSYSSGIYDSAARVIIGESDQWAGNEFDGQIDEVKLWNYALTDEQIRDEYNSGAVRFGE